MSAAIDSEGEVIILSESIFTSQTSEVKSTFLPDNERAVCVACGDAFTIVLGESGHVFELIRGNKFCVVEELFDKKIDKHISGTHDHFFAVCSDGRVFGRGKSQQGAFGLGENVHDSKKFVWIDTLKKYKRIPS